VRLSELAVQLISWRVNKL